MSPDTPIACSLSADELPKRLAEMSAIGKDALMSVTTDGTLRFRADEPTRDRLEAVIAAESECCSFLGLELSEGDGELALTIVAPDGADPIAAHLAAAFAAGAKLA
jgi:hypothetical protein